MGGKDNSPSSSIDSSSHPALSTASSVSHQLGRRDLRTDLSLALSPLTSSPDSCSKERDQVSNWPPIKPLLRSMLKEEGNRTLFVKVYMEGIPIGRKLDLYAHDSYASLIRTLSRMFRASIMCPKIAQVPSNHVLAYEDKEGDWMMVGDVPWELFLTTVKRLKITRADKC